MARRGVDGVAEQQELHDRDKDHGRECEAVSAQLHELLDHHGNRTRQIDHWKLSRDLLIRLMNTSSNDGCETLQWRSGWSRNRATALSSASASRPATCRLLPKGATMSMPASPSSCPDSDCRSGPLTHKVCKCDCAITSWMVPCAKTSP